MFSRFKLNYVFTEDSEESIDEDIMQYSENESVSFIKVC